MLAAAGRIEPGMLEPYAIVTARNVVASMWRDEDRQRRHQHRVVDLRPPEAPDEDVLAQEDRAAIAEALRPALRARAGDPAGARGRRSGHPVAGRGAGHDGRCGGRPAQPHPGPAAGRVPAGRSSDVEPPTERCRPVLLALSSGDRRRQREVDAARHLLECEVCARLSEPLMERGRRAGRRGPRRRPHRRRRRRRAAGRARAGRPAGLLRDRPDA